MPTSEPQGVPPLDAEERTAYALGCRSFERGEVDTALQAFRRLLATRPRFADVHYRVGLLYERKGDLDAAARSLEQALRINPAYGEARLALVTVHERRGDFLRGEEVAREGAATAPRAGAGAADALTESKLANLQAALGDAYREAGELRDAIEAYRKALARRPTFHDVRTRLAMALREAGLPHQAIRELERVVRVQPSHLEAAVQLGLTWFTLGRAHEALACWRRSLAQDPTREDARMYLRLVEAWQRRPQPAGARPGEGHAAAASSRAMTRAESREATSAADSIETRGGGSDAT